MANSDNETVIVINDQDYEEGFFRFYTSKRNHYDKLLSRIGGEENLIKLKAVGSSWDCWVPVKYFLRSTFGIGQKRQVSEEQRAKLTERLAEMRSNKKPLAGLGEK